MGKKRQEGGATTTRVHNDAIHISRVTTDRRSIEGWGQETRGVDAAHGLIQFYASALKGLGRDSKFGSARRRNRGSTKPSCRNRWTAQVGSIRHRLQKSKRVRRCKRGLSHRKRGRGGKEHASPALGSGKCR